MTIDRGFLNLRKYMKNNIKLSIMILIPLLIFNTFPITDYLTFILKRHGGFLDYGDFIVLKGTDGKDGVYQVKDTMNKRFVNRIDILESPGTKPYKFDSAKIVKTNLVLNN